MTPLEQFLSRVHDATQCEKGWRARCPAHDDQQPSLSIAEGDDGRVLVNCHAGCSVESVCGALGVTVADLFASPAYSVPTTPATGSQRVRHTKEATRSFATLDDAVAVVAKMAHGSVGGRWTFQDTTGGDVLVVVRLETATGKTFRPLRRVADGWQIGDPPGLLPLYHLPEIGSAERVFVTEGEKAAEAARSIGLVATTSAHGAKSPQKTDWTPLAGKDVIILPDNDDVGRDYAEKVASILSTLSPPARVRVVELPGLPEHGDVYDFLEQRDAAEPEALKEMIEQLAVEVTPVDGATKTQPRVSPRDAFPVEVLPEPIRSFVVAGAAAIGCDPSYLALPLLSAIASAIGNTRRIELKRGWSEPAILWTACVGESGSLKTPAFKLVMRPLREHQARALADYSQAMSDHERALMEYERSLTFWKRSKAQDWSPVKPILPEARRFIVSDTTVEALAPLLRANPRGLLMARDELAGWFGSFDRYATGKGADSANWLSMHGAETITVDRKTGMPRTINVPRAAVSVAGGIQPGILARSLGVEHRESGLAARLLSSWPSRLPKRWTEADIDPAMEAELSQLFAELIRLQPLDGDEANCEPVLVPLSFDAKQAWIKFYNEQGNEQVQLDRDLAAAWSKLEGYAARLALVIHCVRSAANDPALKCPNEIDVASIEAGIALSRWFGNEARRIYVMLDEGDDERDDRMLRDWLERRGGCVTVREVQQGNRRLASADDARSALDRLAQKGWGNWQSTGSNDRSGRPSERFELRPLVRLATPVYETSKNAVFSIVS